MATMPYGKSRSKQNADGSLEELKDGDVVATIGDLELVFQPRIKEAKLFVRKAGGGREF